MSYSDKILCGSRGNCKNNQIAVAKVALVIIYLKTVIIVNISDSCQIMTKNGRITNVGSSVCIRESMGNELNMQPRSHSQDNSS